MKTKQNSVLIELLRETFPNPGFVDCIYVDSDENDFVQCGTFCTISLNAWIGIDLEFITDFRDNLNEHGYTFGNFYIDPMRSGLDGSYINLSFMILSNER